ncbi:transporter substrate-binding domain-containing protein [Methylocystis sp.]|uniref:transporter substrate-binding domain-containing protein n=1 Tax=Methylocystis sp. TaxID=1911079 RepID=UPI003D1188E8
MDKIQSRGRLIAGVSYDIPGMGYKNPKTGQIEGFEADLARAMAKDLLGDSDRVDLHQVTDEGRIAALQRDQVDVVISQLTITPARAREVDFTTPYYVTREAILVPRDSDIKGFEDLIGKRIVVTAGSVSGIRMRAALPSLPGATLLVTPLSSGNLEAVDKGEADAASNDMINLTLLRKGASNPNLYEIIDIGDRFDPKPFGMAVKKGNAELLARLNAAIDALQADKRIDEMLASALASVGRG